MRKDEPTHDTTDDASQKGQKTTLSREENGKITFSLKDVPPQDDSDESQSSSASKMSLSRSKRFLRIGYFILGLAIVLAILAQRYYSATRLRIVDKIGEPAGYLSRYQKISDTLYFEAHLDELTRVNLTQTDRQVVSISELDSADEVVDRMVRLGIVTDRALFRRYLIYRGIDRRLVPGMYLIPEQASAVQAAEALISAKQRLFQYGVLPGLRLEEIAAGLALYDLLFSADAFLAAARNYPPEKHPTGDVSLEGYILSGNYMISRSISLEAFLDGLVRTFVEAMSSEMLEGFSKQGLSVSQAVTIASMVTREAQHESEFGLIASVFVNRFHAGMKFQCDPTVQYGLGWDEIGRTWWKPELTRADLDSYSPYNTYVIDGFPPTAISSISLKALQAVSSPPETNFYYFRAACNQPGYHAFSTTYEEHVRKECPTN